MSSNSSCPESSLDIAGLGHTSIGCVVRYMDQVRCVLVPVAVGQGHLTWILGSRHLSLRVPSLQTFSLSRKAGFIDWCLRRLCFRWMPTRLKAFLELPSGHVWVTVLHLESILKKAMFYTHAYGGRLTNTEFKLQLC